MNESKHNHIKFFPFLLFLLYSIFRVFIDDAASVVCFLKPRNTVCRCSWIEQSFQVANYIHASERHFHAITA